MKLIMSYSPKSLRVMADCVARATKTAGEYLLENHRRIMAATEAVLDSTARARQILAKQAGKAVRSAAGYLLFNCLRILAAGSVVAAGIVRALDILCHRGTGVWLANELSAS